MKFPKVFNNKGFALIEVLIVMAIFAAITSIVLLIGFNGFRGYSFRSERDMVIATLHKARNQAVNNICLGVGCTNGKLHGVAFPPLTPDKKYIIFQGANFASRDVTMDEVIDLNYQANISGLSEISFNSLSGDPIPSQSSLTISDSNGHSSVISINSEGQITWTN